MKSITKEDIFDAYQKFKSFVYYDNSNLHIRYKLASYEKEKIEDKLNNLAFQLNLYIKGTRKNKINDWIKESSYITAPKTVKEEDAGKEGDNNAIYITNKTSDSFNVSKITILYDAPIEIFIISTLWTIFTRKYFTPNSDCYGYKFNCSNDSKLLFEPYFKNYQKWRDNGINIAKQQINNGNNVLLLSLDIKNYFHSVNIDFNELRHNIPKNDTICIALTNIIEKISSDHSYKLAKDNIVLPIGLPSSATIANWVLAEFDKDIKNATAPIYYGRYVDDIFIVIANVEPNKENPAEWLCSRFFNDKKIIEKEDKTLDLKSPRCNGLQIQTEKMRLFYIDHTWSQALINKFQATIQENSSAFWFLPDEEDLKDCLDDTYDLQYEDSINKFRSVLSCKVNKYQASVFLAKRIKLAILSSKSHEAKLEHEIFRFFKGVSIISMYSMWEKVFTYFEITGNTKAIKKLTKEITNAITLLKLDTESLKEILEEATIEHIENDKLIRAYLTNHLKYCQMLAKSFVIINKGNYTPEEKEIIDGCTILKKGLLTRQYNLPLPAYALTKDYIEKGINLPTFHLEDIKNSIHTKYTKHQWLIPRHISLHEICALTIPYILQKGIKAFYKDKKNAYIERCCTLYQELNKYSIKDKIQLKNYNTTSNHDLVTHLIKIPSEISSKDKISIGISNVKTNIDDIQTAMIKKSMVNRERRKRHINILNQAERLKVDFLLLPEVFVPVNWLCAYGDESRRKDRAMIFGLEHFTINKQCFNFSITILPFTFKGKKEAFIIPRLKNHYSPNETNIIHGYGKEIPTKPFATYHLYCWKGIQFSVYNCYELTDIVHRSTFKSDLDILFAIEYNKDVNYFSNISESICRDLHCYYVQVNTSDYGDSRIIEPKETVFMNPIRIKGGTNDTILKGEVNIKKLRQFQQKSLLLQKDDKDFKMTPPNFEHKKANQRGK